MELVKRLAEISLSPVGIMVELLAAGILLSLSGRYVRTGRRALTIGAGTYLFFLFSPLSELSVRSLERHFAPLLVPPADRQLRNILVLSGYGQDHPSFPITSNLSESTICSLVEGVRLHRLLPRSRLLVSGGVLRAGDRPVAAMMADFLVQMGIPATDIAVEGKSTNTYENLAESRALTGSEPFILVAAACDLRRAVAVARKLGMRPVPAPAYFWALQHYPAEMTAGEWTVNIMEGFAYPSHERLARLQWAYHEYVGYLWYRLLGRV